MLNRSDLEKLKVNAQELLLAEKTGKIKGLIVTLKGNCHEKRESYDFYSRYFAPWYGVAEDPVTGVFPCLHRTFLLISD